MHEVQNLELRCKFYQIYEGSMTVLRHVEAWHLRKPVVIALNLLIKLITFIPWTAPTSKFLSKQKIDPEKSQEINMEVKPIAKSLHIENSAILLVD